MFPVHFTRMASASVLKRLTQRAEEAEKIISQLRATIEVIRQNAAISVSKPEEERVKKENQELKQEIENLKVQLVMAEIRNGVKQVSIPLNRSVKQFSSTPQEPAAVQPQTAGKGNNPEKKENTGKAKKNTGEKKPKDGAKGEPQAKKVKGGSGGSAEPEVMDVSRLDFRVGKIVEVEKHPDADSLYIEKVDLGEGRLRTVVSGLVKFVPIEEMQNKVAVFMCNLKPAKMRGVSSEAMIMCARGMTSDNVEKVEILQVPSGSEIGDRVTFDNYSGTPDAMLNPKKKVWETLKPDLSTNAEKAATFKGAKMKIEGKGIIVAPSLANVPIQ